jgi:hypothetical protein
MGVVLKFTAIDKIINTLIHHFSWFSKSAESHQE